MFGKGCAFTGHREMDPQERGRLEKLLDETIEALAFDGFEIFYCGGAVGFDMMAAEAVLRNRDAYGIRLCLALPFPHHADCYSPVDRERYGRIYAAADEKIMVSNSYDIGSFHLRDRYMIDRAEVCVSYLKEKQGGTAYTVKYAEKRGVRTINLAEKV